MSFLHLAELNLFQLGAKPLVGLFQAYSLMFFMVKITFQ